MPTVTQPERTRQRKTRPIVCYGQTNNGRWCQEMYCTTSRDAGRRARQLRATGRFRVNVSGLGYQVTPVGRVRLTMVDIRPLYCWDHTTTGDTFYLPTDGWSLRKVGA